MLFKKRPKPGVDFTVVKRAFVFSLILSSLAFHNVSAQQNSNNFFSRYIHSLLNDTTDISKPQLLFYPALSYAPETSWELGLSGLYIFYAKSDTLNRISEIKAYTFYTLENQYGVHLNHSLVSDKNNWMALGRIRYQYFPLLYFGIGPGSDKDYLARVDARQLQIRERILRKIGPDFYLGAAIEYQRLSFVKFVTENRPPLPVLPAGAEGSANLGLGLAMVLDARQNILNVRKGAFYELAVIRYDKAWGSDYAFTNIVSDTRIFLPVNKRDVVATQILGQFNKGHTPFNQLSQMGGENIMRGYYLGRYRDKNLLAGQVEYRFLPLPLGFSNRWGAALFGGTGAVFPELRTLDQSDFVWSAGGGLRFLIFPKKDIFSRLDVAFTKEGPGFYIFIGEAF